MIEVENDERGFPAMKPIPPIEEKVDEWEKEVMHLVDIARGKALVAKEDAAWNGSFGDGGAQIDLNLINAFMSGWRRTLPPFLERIKKQVDRAEDNDRKEYERLKRKYEGVQAR